MENNHIAYPINPLIENRKSIRSFLNKEVSENDLHRMFEAARWSFSSSNEQPWRFIYGKNKDKIWEVIFNSLMDGNKSWCVHAPILVLVLSKKLTSKGLNYKHNLHDTGAATMLLSLQAVDMGLQVHPMGGFMPDKLSIELNIPEQLEMVSILAIGYPNHDYSLLSEKQRLSESARGSRLTQEELILNNNPPLLK